MTHEPARQYILNHYSVSSAGRILSKGKFTGQLLYVPHFWQKHLNGLSDGSDDGIEVYFVVLKEDLDAFPELAGKGHVVLIEDGMGNVFEVCEGDDYPDIED